MLSNMMYKLYQLTVSGRGSVCSSMYMIDMYMSM